MRRSLLLIVVMALAAGCQYEPLDNQANKPRLANAVLSRDIIVTGTAYLLYLQNNDGNLGSFLCTAEQNIEGWASDELNDESCIGCGRTFTLGMSTVETTCDFGTGAAADIAFTPLDFLDRTTNESLGNWLDENEAVEYLNTTWEPRGSSEWKPRMGVFEDDWATDPSDHATIPSSSPNGTCQGQYCAQGRFWYGTADWWSRFWFDLDIDLDEA